MAKKVYIDFELRYKEAVANLDEMQKEYTKLEKKVEKYDDAVQESSESAKEMGGVLDSVTGGAITKFKGLGSTVGNVIKGFKSLRVAIIATGIGALALAVGAVISAFTRSEKGQDRFAKILGVIQAVIGELMDRLADFGELIINVLSEPGKIWQGFVDIMKAGYERIKLQVIDRFAANFTLLVGGIQKGILKMRIAWNKFTGDSVEAEKLTNQLDKVNAKMDEARETISRANKSLVDDFNEISRLVASGREDLRDYLEELERNLIEEGKMAQKRADIISAANKQERQLIVERAKADRKIAELREKAADKENVSIEDRIAALKEAGKIEEEITNKEISLAAKRLKAKQIENQMGKSTREDKEEEAQLEARLIELETGRLKLQKALTAEITTALREAKAERNAETAEFLANNVFVPGVGFISKEAFDKMKADGEAIEKIQEEFRKKKEDEAAETELQKLELEKSRKLQELDDLDATSAQKADIILYYNDLIKKAEDKDAEDAIKREKLIQQQKIAIVSQTFGTLANVLGKNSKAGKAFAIAQALTNTYQGITEVLDTKSTLPEPFATISRITNIATVLATGFQAVKSIKSVNPKGGSAATTISAGGASQAGSQAPAFNVVGASSANQLAEVIGEQQQQPVQAFVVSNDVTTAQELDRNIIQGATIG